MKEAFKPSDLPRTISDEDRIRLHEYAGRLRSLEGYRAGRATFQKALSPVDRTIPEEPSLGVTPLPHGEMKVYIDVPGFKAQAAIPSIEHLADMSANAVDVLKNKMVRVEGGRLKRRLMGDLYQDTEVATEGEVQAQQTIVSSIEIAKAQILGIADAASEAGLVRLALKAYSWVTLEEHLTDAISRKEAESAGTLADIAALFTIIQRFNPIRVSMVDDPDFLEQLWRGWLKDPSVFNNTLGQIRRQEILRQLFEVA